MKRANLVELQRRRLIAYYAVHAYFVEEEANALVANEFGYFKDGLREIGDRIGPMLPPGAVVAQVRPVLAELSEKADHAASWQGRYEQSRDRVARTYREAWFRFMDADRAVERAGGTSVLGREAPMPGTPKDLAVRLTDLEEAARASEAERGSVSSRRKASRAG